MKEAPPFIESIQLPDRVLVNESTIITIHANWPTPLWKTKDLTVNPDWENRRVDIVCMGVSGSGMTMQRLEPFSFIVEVSFPIVGTWTIVVKGKADEHRREIIVHK